MIALLLELLCEFSAIREWPRLPWYNQSSQLNYYESRLKASSHHVRLLIHHELRADLYA
jgi:hypothetical protein